MIERRLPRLPRSLRAARDRAAGDLLLQRRRCAGMAWGRAEVHRAPDPGGATRSMPGRSDCDRRLADRAATWAGADRGRGDQRDAWPAGDQRVAADTGAAGDLQRSADHGRRAAAAQRNLWLRQYCRDVLRGHVADLPGGGWSGGQPARALDALRRGAAALRCDAADLQPRGAADRCRGHPDDHAWRDPAWAASIRYRRHASGRSRPIGAAGLCGSA